MNGRYQYVRKWKQRAIEMKRKRVIGCLCGLFIILLYAAGKRYVFPTVERNVDDRMLLQEGAHADYSLNCRFVFHTERKIKTTVHYFALAGFILIMNNLILEMFVQAFHMSVYPAKLLTECLLFVLSWLIQNCVIFRKGKCLTATRRKAKV